MVIFLDKQRPPKKRMGRLQRKGSKSNPATGVQWANWLDDPSGAPGGGGGGTPPPTPTLTTITPSSLIITDPPTLLTVTGTGFTADCVLMMDSTPLASTFVDDVTITATFTPDAVMTSHSASVRNNVSGESSNGYTFMVYASAQADPTSSWTKHAIIAWLIEKGVDIDPGAEGHFTKAELLDIVEAYLNGDPVDDLLGG